MQSASVQHLAATERVVAYLMSREDTFGVSRCEEDDINGDPLSTLVWYYSSPEVKPIKVLVRGDRFNNGHLYVETSTDAEDTPGGSLFLDSPAVYLFYYFLATSELFIIPLAEFRDWVMSNIDSFEARRMAVRHGEEYRVELGRLIPLSHLGSFPRIQKLHI